MRVFVRKISQAATLTLIVSPVASAKTVAVYLLARRAAAKTGSPARTVAASLTVATSDLVLYQNSSAMSQHHARETKFVISIAFAKSR